jgi:hypothetical protein
MNNNNFDSTDNNQNNTHSISSNPFTTREGKNLSLSEPFINEININPSHITKPTSVNSSIYKSCSVYSNRDYLCPSSYNINGQQQQLFMENNNKFEYSYNVVDVNSAVDLNKTYYHNPDTRCQVYNPRLAFDDLSFNIDPFQLTSDL